MDTQWFGGQQRSVTYFDLLNYLDKSFTSLLLFSHYVYRLCEVFVQRDGLLLWI